MWLDFWKSHFNGLKYIIKVVLPGRIKCGGTEEEIVVAHGCRKRKKLICGTEEEIVVAHGCLPSPTPLKIQWTFDSNLLLTNKLACLKGLENHKLQTRWSVNMRKLIKHTIVVSFQIFLYLQVKTEFSLCHQLRFSIPYMFATFFKF